MDFIEEKWKIIEQGITAVYKKIEKVDQNGIDHLSEIVFRMLFGKTTNKKCFCGEPSEETKMKFLYSKLEAYLENFLKTMYEPIAEDATGEIFLRHYLGQWLEYNDSTTRISLVFAHLNYALINYSPKPGEREYPMVVRLAAIIWKKIKFDPICEKLTREFLSFVDINRKSAADPKASGSLYQRMVEYYICMGCSEKQPLACFQAFLEKPFMKQTEIYYIQRRSKFLERATNVRMYLSFVRNLLTEEEAWFRSSFARFSCEMQHIKNRVFNPSQLKVYQDEFKCLLKPGNDLELKLFYVEMKEIFPSLHMFVEIFGMEFRKECLPPFANTVGAKFVVERIYRTVKRYINLLKTIFRKEEAMLTVLKSEITILVNLEDVMKMIQKYCEHLFSYGDHDWLNFGLSVFLELFFFVEDKDSVLKVFSSCLMKWYTSTLYMPSNLSLLKEAFKNPTNIQRAVFEVNKSKRIMYAFENHMFRSKTKYEVNMTAKILPISLWPYKKRQIPLILPKQMEEPLKTFTDFDYTTQASKRKLTWLYELSKVELRTVHRGKLIKVIGNTIHMVILLQFNDRDSMTFDELKAKTGLEKDHLIRGLRSIIEEKLLATDAKKNFDSDSEVSIVHGFRPHKRYIILQYQNAIEEEQEERIPSSKYNAGDRTQTIQAILAKIMKKEKTMTSTKLVQVAYEELSKIYTPSVSDIKKNIEWLKEKDYIEEDLNDKNVYKYIP